MGSRLRNQENMGAMVEPCGLTTQRLFGLSRRAYDEFPAGQGPDEVASPILIRGKSAEEKINCPEVHHSSLRRKAIEAVGTKQRFLPAYSPDLNLIENAYAKIKSDLRKGGARTVDALWKLVGRSVKAIAPSECAGYFRHAGYRA